MSPIPRGGDLTMLLRKLLANSKEVYSQPSHRWAPSSLGSMAHQVNVPDVKAVHTWTATYLTRVFLLPSVSTWDPWKLHFPTIHKRSVNYLSEGNTASSHQVFPLSNMGLFLWAHTHGPDSLSGGDVNQHLVLISIVDILGMRTWAIREDVCLYLINVRCIPLVVSSASPPLPWHFFLANFKDSNYFSVEC